MLCKRYAMYGETGTNPTVAMFWRRDVEARSPYGLCGDFSSSLSDYGTLIVGSPDEL